MSIPSDLTGVFWLPDHPDHKLAGHLLSDSGRLRLELHGVFPDANLVQTQTYPLILGVGSGSEFVTLRGCVTTGGHVGGFEQQHLSVDLVFHGGHFTEDELIFSDVEFKTDHLADWAARSGFAHTVPTPEGMRWQVGLRALDPLVADLGDQGQLRIAYEGGLNRQQGSVTLTEAPAILGTSPSAVGHRDVFDRFLFPMRNLVTFATMSPAYLSSIVVRGPNAVRSLPSGATHRVDVEVLHTFLQPRDEDRVVGLLTPNRMLFAFADWPGDFTSLITHWLDLSRRHEASLNLVMGLAYAPPRWQATRVLTLVQAIEAYHRVEFEESPESVRARERKAHVVTTVRPHLNRSDFDWLEARLMHAHEPSLTKRLQEATHRVQSILDPLIADIGAFARDLANVRHTYSHFGAGDADRDAVRREYVLGRQAYWVLVANYLLDLGFSADQAKALLARNAYFTNDLNPQWIEI